MTNNSSIDGERLWNSLMSMAEIGATEKGGSCRLALSDADRAGRELFMKWSQEAGYRLTTDAIGNLFVRREGADNAMAPVVMGSHLDTQPTGGRFDGVLGVLAGLEVLRSLDDGRITTRRPIEVAVWMNEEGARFSPPMMGSGVWSGTFSREEIVDVIAQDGARLGDELVRLGWDGDTAADHRADPKAAYFELHIEQGPVLEAANCPIGIVTGAQGQRWYELTLTGQEAHAGPTPMRLRRDALVGAARVVELVHAFGESGDDYTCATVGVLDVFPHSRNVIPGRVFLTVDLRHPQDSLLDTLDNRLRNETARIAEATGLKLDLREFWHFPATAFDPTLIGRIRDAVDKCGYGNQDIVSGAGHDAVYVSRVCPTAMIFVPCEGGISHNESESIQPIDAKRGTEVLFDAVLATATSH